MLSTAKIIKLNEDNYSFEGTELGQLMAKYYLQFETVAQLRVQPTQTPPRPPPLEQHENNPQEIDPNSSLRDLLALFSRSAEFKEMRIKMGEKGILNGFGKVSTCAAYTQISEEKGRRFTFCFIHRAPKRPPKRKKPPTAATVVVTRPTRLRRCGSSSKVMRVGANRVESRRVEIASYTV